MPHAQTAIRSLVQDLRLHFRCEFQVSQGASPDPPLDRIIALAQKWVVLKNKGSSRGLGGAWFADRGQWISPSQNRVRLEVDSATRDSGTTRFWAMRYEHPNSIGDHGASFRQWRTDLALATVEKTVVVSMHVSHYLVPGHFGPEPTMPEPTSPLLVKNLFQTAGLTTFAGSQILTAKPVEVTADVAEHLVERIRDQNRRCPLIYISRAFNTGEPLINPSGLAWSLAGLATVYVAESNWLDKATEKLLPPDYRCWNGTIRVYLPNVQFDRPQDFKRHRYFTPDQIGEQGAREVERVIVQSLARRVALSSAIPVLNIDDVRLKRQEEQFEYLKSQLESAPPAEMLELMESINRDLEQKFKTVDTEQKRLAEQLEWSELEVEAKDDELKKSRYREEAARAEANLEREKRVFAETRAERLGEMNELPDSIEKCCQVLAEAFPDRIEFTDKALESTRKSNFSKVNVVWTALWHIANTLHAIAFPESDSSVDLEDEFLRRSGIKLALSEGKLTKANTKLMQSRSQHHRGEKIDITPHLKLEAAGKHLRIHLHIHKERRVVVVGHCGNHLETAGTSRRK